MVGKGDMGKYSRALILILKIDVDTQKNPFEKTTLMRGLLDAKCPLLLLFIWYDTLLETRGLILLVHCFPVSFIKNPVFGFL